MAESTPTVSKRVIDSGTYLPSSETRRGTLSLGEDDSRKVSLKRLLRAIRLLLAPTET